MLDCIVIGGGPAGLVAATYLGRFLRKVQVVDSGESRLQRIPLSRNVPGFPDGIEGAALLERLQRQADAYGTQRLAGLVERIETIPGGFRITVSGRDHSARTLLLATGVGMKEPAIERLDEAVAKSLIRYCPICDGFEAQGKRVAVLGGRKASVQEAQFLRRYVEDLTFIAAEDAFRLKPDEEAGARSEGVEIAEGTAMAVEMCGDRIRIALSTGQVEDFDVVYPCLGAQPRSELFSSIGGKVCPDGGILTDRHQETSIPGLYAAGDVLKGLDQIASACGQAAIAATAIHNRLREDDRAVRQDRS